VPLVISNVCARQPLPVDSEVPAAIRGISRRLLYKIPIVLLLAIANAIPWFLAKIRTQWVLL
jgi:hypothetical protein